MNRLALATVWLSHFAVLVLGCSGCAAINGGGQTGDTIATSQEIPGDEILKFFDSSESTAFMDLKFDGYVVLEGPISSDNTVGCQIVYSYPDATRDRFAEELASVVRIPRYTVGTRVVPRAVVYVVFFEKGMLRRKALVYGKQKDTGIGPNNLISAGGFLKIGVY